MLQAKLTKIEPCKCGSNNLRLMEVFGCFSVQCKDCHVDGSLGDTRPEAVEKWNKETGEKGEVKYEH